MPTLDDFTWQGRWDFSVSANVHLSGASITQIDDVAGNYNLAQSTGAAQPTQVVAGLNGLNGASFDGGDFLFKSAFTSVGGNVGTWCCVFKPSQVGNGSFGHILGLTQAGVQAFSGTDRIAALLLQDLNPVDGAGNYYNNTFRGRSTTAADQTAHILICRRNGDTSNAWLDSGTVEADTSPVTGLGTANFAITSAVLGSDIDSSADNAYHGELYFAGWINDATSSIPNLYTALHDKWFGTVAGVDLSPVQFAPPGKIVPGSRFTVFPLGGTDLTAPTNIVTFAGAGANANTGAGDLWATMALAGHADNANDGDGNALALMSMAGHGDNANDGRGLLRGLMAMSGHGDNANDGDGDLLARMAMAGHGDNANTGAGFLQALMSLAGHGDNANTGAGFLQALMALAGHGDNANDGRGLLLLLAALAGHGDNANDGDGDLLSTAGGNTVLFSGAGANANDARGLLLLTAALSGHGDNANTGALALLLLRAALSGAGPNANTGAGFLLRLAQLAGAGPNANDGDGDLLSSAAPVGAAVNYRLGTRRAVAPRSHGIRD